MARAARKTPTKRAAAGGTEEAARILEATLALAEEVGWDSVRLREVSARLELPMTAVLAHYRDLDAVADAWFRRGWDAMLAPPPEDFEAMPARERLYLVMMRWFEALASHRRVTGDMLSGKLYPSHPHHWVPMIFNLSRTIHWLRDAARLDATGRRRQMEEVGLTLLFLATLARWLRDDGEGFEATRRFLRRRLARADRAMAWLWRSPDSA